MENVKNRNINGYPAWDEQLLIQAQRVTPVGQVRMPDGSAPTLRYKVFINEILVGAVLKGVNDTWMRVPAGVTEHVSHLTYSTEYSSRVRAIQKLINDTHYVWDYKSTGHQVSLF